MTTQKPQTKRFEKKTKQDWMKLLLQEEVNFVRTRKKFKQEIY